MHWGRTKRASPPPTSKAPWVPTLAPETAGPAPSPAPHLPRLSPALCPPQDGTEGAGKGRGRCGLSRQPCGSCLGGEGHVPFLCDWGSPVSGGSRGCGYDSSLRKFQVRSLDAPGSQVYHGRGSRGLRAATGSPRLYTESQPPLHAPERHLHMQSASPELTRHHTPAVVFLAVHTRITILYMCIFVRVCHQ